MAALDPVRKSGVLPDRSDAQDDSTRQATSAPWSDSPETVGSASIASENRRLVAMGRGILVADARGERGGGQ